MNVIKVISFGAEIDNAVYIVDFVKISDHRSAISLNADAILISSISIFISTMISFIFLLSTVFSRFITEIFYTRN
jgi:hypothetical protein